MEELFNDEKLDRLFVKNIETVQGDERDIILISSCYGPNGKGFISHNFGAINKEGGYRRLNVAFSRAKECAVIVTSLKSVDIDLNRTSARGVEFLKEYLQYAEFGSYDEKVDKLKYEQKFDSEFEKSVYLALKNRGLNLQTQVGASGYRIDLGILDPKQPNKFILGIECDGATFHSSKTARDRDISRQAVLEKRGWTIHRIWSTDWFKNPKKEVDKIISLYNSLINSAYSKDKQMTHVNNVNDNFFKIEAKTEDSFKDKFEEFPNLNLFLSKKSSLNDFVQLINKAAPVHTSLLNSIANKYGFSTFKYFLNSGALNKFKSLIFIDSNNFVRFEGKKTKFRKENPSFKRKTSQISYDEYAALIIEVLNYKPCQKEELFEIIKDFCGFQNINSKRIEIWNDVLERLILSKKVFYNKNNLIELAK